MRKEGSKEGRKEGVFEELVRNERRDVLLVGGEGFFFFFFFFVRGRRLVFESFGLWG